MQSFVFSSEFYISEQSVASPLEWLMPPSVRACEVSCGQNCELGQWQAWSVCSHSCGTQGRKIRSGKPNSLVTKVILVIKTT